MTSLTSAPWHVLHGVSTPGDAPSSCPECPEELPSCPIGAPQPLRGGKGNPILASLLARGEVGWTQALRTPTRRDTSRHDPGSTPLRNPPPRCSASPGHEAALPNLGLQHSKKQTRIYFHPTAAPEAEPPPAALPREGLGEIRVKMEPESTSKPSSCSFTSSKLRPPQRGLKPNAPNVPGKASPGDGH